FKKSMPDGICRIGVRQPIYFAGLKTVVCPCWSCGTFSDVITYPHGFFMGIPDIFFCIDNISIFQELDFQS
ncbi:MAG TPA: hypothetical protein PLJ85_04260, partial [Candidatus Cloacimonas sp.]|nr:hypothetical protein [Candidatus Cloacimonas sp.]